MWRADVETANAEADEAEAAAKAARDDDKAEAVAAAKTAAEAAAEVLDSVPEEHKTYGVKVCGSALGDKDFELAFLGEQQAKIVGAIESVSTKLAVNSAHAASTAIYYSLQCRADFLLETHLPSLTRDLAVAVDGALRGAYTTAFGFDILNPDGQFSGERDPTFLRDLAGLKARAGGCGYRSTERRAVFLNTLNNVLPQMIGEYKTRVVAITRSYPRHGIVQGRQRSNEMGSLLRLGLRVGPGIRVGDRASQNPTCRRP